MDSPLAPPAGGLRRRLALPALVVGVLALLFVANDRFVAHGREVVVLNRTGLSAQIQAPGLEPITLADKGFRVLVLGEGLHTIQVQLGERPARDVEVPVVGSVLDRLMGGRVFLLNLDAAAPIVWEETVYGPPGEKPTLAPTRIELGEVLVFERVDEVLVPFPDDSPEGPRVRIGVAPAEPARLFGARSPAQRAEPGALRFAEHHLQRTPENDALLALYVSAARADHAATGADFLARRLAERPVRVPWHRAYQDLRRSAGKVSAVRDEYLAWSAKEPDNASLLVLGGRLKDDPDEALAAYRAGLKADSDEAFGHYGVAVHLFRRGEFTDARVHADVACRLRPRDANFANLRFLIRAGQGDWSALASELERALERDPTSFVLFERLIEAQIASDRGDAARATTQAFKQRLSDRPDPRQLALLAALSLSGLEGRWEEFRRALVRLEDKKRRARLTFQAALGEGMLDQAGEPNGPSDVLQLTLAWSLKADGAAQGKTWRERLSASLSAGNGAWPALGAALASGDLDGLPKLALSPDDKACALYLLAAERPPGQRAPYLERAVRYDLGRRYPHALLVRAKAALSAP